jgi:hypothetical protein
MGTRRWRRVEAKEDKTMLRRSVVGIALGIVLTVGIAGATLAADPHTGGTTGQPNQSCQAQPDSPGQAAAAPGSAFNPDGVAGTHYAGQQPQNSKNPNSVAQYDVACFQVSTNH